MFFNTQFNILAVDDEPDVLALTKMLLRDVTVYGLPVHVETARSKAEAIEILEEYRAASAGGVQQMIAVALIDVVMETDHAGLELCDYIRNTQGNHVTQLFIRTGQPGAAPERKVVDDYDINGYFTKTEMDEDKLYSIVKSGIRQAETVSAAVGVLTAASAIVENAQSREAISGVMNQIVASIGAGGGSDGQEMAKVDVVTLVDGGEKLMGNISAEEAEARWQKIVQMPHHPLNDQGDWYVVDGKTLAIYLAPSDSIAEARSIFDGQMEPTPFLIATMHPYGRMIAAEWKRAGNGQHAG
jgi:CheY-like chemotaxis protein